ncbi:6-phosphogluconate dehydrogenase, decarboxylating 2-like isoform X1 [Tasmannia lanceolata]|uniref:6-phosphogluconate dehydrogenase, decarboxylating 2-like isoform X1 n=1 Tax=Tasmannia lanceolata TaxID=3420 RepID=UPI0040630A10
MTISGELSGRVSVPLDHSGIESRAFMFHNRWISLRRDFPAKFHLRFFRSTGIHDSRSIPTVSVSGIRAIRIPDEGKTMDTPSSNLSRIGLVGLAVMGQNLALNIAEKGFQISIYNRTTSKVDETVERAKREGDLPLLGFHDPESFVNSIQKPRVIIMLVKAGAPVDQTIKTLTPYMEKDDCIIDGGNEWYENTERREAAVAELGLLYLGMGVSGGEEGARNGPSLMPGGSFKAYKNIEDILLKVAAQVPDSGPCVTYIGKGGSGNFVKMVHNGIEYGDMQLIAEAYDVLKYVGKLSNDELQCVFSDWNKGELLSFLIEITADIFGIKDDKGDGYLVDKVLDKTGMKGTGKWTVQQAADLSVAAPTIASSLDARFLSGLKEERVAAAKVFKEGGFSDILSDQHVDKAKLIDDVRQALYSAKICSYAQGMNLIRAKSIEKGWDLKLGELARIWKGGCIIRAIFLDRIKKAYDRNADLPNLLVDPEFAKEIIDRQSAWRRVVCLAINSGISTPGMSTSLAYFDSYRRDRLPANLVQAQRDYFGAHTYERTDIPGAFHTEWFKIAKQSKA